MKRKFLIVASALIMGASHLSATGYPVFDISGWLTALDQLYSQYDMVMNTVTQIENQYRQIQQAVERAKSIDWENIRFDKDTNSLVAMRTSEFLAEKKSQGESRGKAAAERVLLRKRSLRPRLLLKRCLTRSPVLRAVREARLITQSLRLSG